MQPEMQHFTIKIYDDARNTGYIGQSVTPCIKKWGDMSLSLYGSTAPGGSLGRRTFLSLQRCY